jgi:hypothetical protein
MRTSPLPLSTQGRQKCIAAAKGYTCPQDGSEDATHVAYYFEWHVCLKGTDVPLQFGGCKCLQFHPLF